MGDFLKSIIKKVFIIFLCISLFLGLSYAYLYFNFNISTKAVDQKEDTVPYRNLPDNAGIAFILPDSSAVLMYLDFENNCINAVNIEKYDKTNTMYYGYTADFTVELDYTLISEIVDRVGGVDIEINGEIMRYTGVHIIDLISTDSGDELKLQIIDDVFSRISKNNFSKDDFLYIIENSNSNLTVVDCVYWLDYMDEMFSNINFVN